MEAQFGGRSSTWGVVVGLTKYCGMYMSRECSHTWAWEQLHLSYILLQLTALLLLYHSLQLSSLLLRGLSKRLESRFLLAPSSRWRTVLHTFWRLEVTAFLTGKQLLPPHPLIHLPYTLTLLILFLPVLQKSFSTIHKKCIFSSADRPVSADHRPKLTQKPVIKDTSGRPVCSWQDLTDDRGVYTCSV